jgi:hypothetical protein
VYGRILTEILQNTQDQNGGWGESNPDGNDGWELGMDGGGGGWGDGGGGGGGGGGDTGLGDGGEGDADLDDKLSWAPIQDSAIPSPRAAVQAWEASSYPSPFNPPAPAPPLSPPIPVAKVPQTTGDTKPGGSKPSRQNGSDSRGQHDQSAAQSRAPPNPSLHPSTAQSWAPPNPSLQPSAAHVKITSASDMARGAKSATTSAGGGTAVPTNQSGRTRRGQEFWGVPQNVIDASAKAIKTTSTPRAGNVGHSSGGSSRQSFSAWGQPKSVDPWGEPTVANAKRGRTSDQHFDGTSRWSQNGVQQGRGRPVTQAWEKWGRPPDWTKPDPNWGDAYGDDDDDESTESDEWENPTDNWAQPHAQGWTKWGQEAKKVTFAPLGPEGTRSVVSAQQRSDILNSLLNLTGQNQNINAVHQHGVLRHTQQKIEQKQPSKQQQKLQKQSYQQQPHHQHQHPQYQDHIVKKMKKQKGKQKEAPKQADAWGGDGGDGWGTSGFGWDAGGNGGGASGDGWHGNDDGWGDSGDGNGGSANAGNDDWDTRDDSWGNDGWEHVDDKGWEDSNTKGWGNSNDKGWRDGNGNDKGWGNSNHRARGNSNDKGWGDGNGNDKGWGNSNDRVRGNSNDKGWGDSWGDSNDKGWGDNKGRGNDKGRVTDKGWGQDQAWGNDTGWGPIPEEDEDEEEVQHAVHLASSKSQTQKFLWGGKPPNTSYTMPSKTLAHAYKGMTTLLHNGTLP